MDIDNIKIGIDATIYDSIKSGMSILNLYNKLNPESLWFEDHLMGLIPESIWTKDIIDIASFYRSPSLYFDPFIVISYLANTTKKIKFGTCVSDCFRRDPATLAQIAITLSQITNGQFILGLGSGEAMNLIPYGHTFEKPITRLRESIEVIKLLWDNNKVDYKGEIWKLNDAVFSLSPYKKDQTPPIWLAAHGSQGLNLIGQYGKGWIPFFIMIQNEKKYSECLKIIHNSAEKNGRDFSSITSSLLVMLIIDEDQNTALDMVNNALIKSTALLLPEEFYRKYNLSHPLGDGFRGLTDYIPSQYSKSTILEAFQKIPLDLLENIVFYGTTDDIIKKIENYAKFGLKHIIFNNITPFTDPSKLMPSLNSIKTIIEYFK